jgi:hypothetical protein
MIIDVIAFLFLPLSRASLFHKSSTKASFAQVVGEML